MRGRTVQRLEKLKRLYETQQYAQAMQLAKEISLKKIKKERDLFFIVEVYLKNKNYVGAISILQMLYERKKTTKVVFLLGYSFAKKKELEKAEQYYEELISLMPNTIKQHLLRYQLDVEQQKPEEIIILDIERLKQYDDLEKWSCELAHYYAEIGEDEKCLAECEEILLLFPESAIVDQIEQLKQKVLQRKTTISAIEQEKILQKQIGPENVIVNAVNISNIFGNFMKIEAIKQQIIEIFSKIKPLGEMQPFLLIGEKQTGKTRLAQLFVKSFYRLGCIPSAEIAVIRGEQLNGMDVSMQKQFLKNASILIQEAGKLKKETLQLWYQFFKQRQQKGLFILEDDVQGIENLLGEGPISIKDVKYCVVIPEYTAKEWVTFVYDDLISQDYFLEEEAKEVLTALLTYKIGLTARAKRMEMLTQIGQQVIKAAEQRQMKQLRQIVNQRSYATADLLSIKAEDIRRIAQF